MGIKKTAKKPVAKKQTLASKAVGALKGALGGAKSGARGKGGRRHKKSALWYANAIHRLRLKRRYDKLRLGGR